MNRSYVAHVAVTVATLVDSSPDEDIYGTIIIIKDYCRREFPSFRGPSQGLPRRQRIK